VSDRAVTHGRRSAATGGSWNTRWGDGQQNVLDLIQIGADVSVTYAGTSQGTMTGSIAGKVLTGHWAGSAPATTVASCSTSARRARTSAAPATSVSHGTPEQRNNGGPRVGTCE